MNKINEQFNWVVGLLNNQDVPYWLDDGTLLGVIRDNRLIESDRDIDLGIWAGDQTTIDPLIPEIEDAGYRFIKKTYHGYPVGYTFYPRKNPNHDRTINVKIYHRENGHAWSPAREAVDRSEVSSILWHISKTYWRIIFALKDEKRVPARPIRLYNIRTYWIPINFLNNIVRCDECNAPIPQDWKKYFEFRFGEDWQIPTDDWNYLFDDGGIRPESPPELVNI